MAALLALLSAATYGVGDFCGGLAARRVPATTVLLWSHLVGLLLAASCRPCSSPASSRRRPRCSAALGGLAGAAGVGLLYKGLSVGQMSVVAPVTALLSAAVPVIAGMMRGRPPPDGGGGMAVALVAIVLVSAEGGAPCGRPTSNT